MLLLWAGLAVLLEGTARVYVPLRGYDLDGVRRGYDERREQRLSRQWPDQDRDHPYLPYVFTTQPPDVQMRGLRLTSRDEVKPPGVFRVFCLGGSTTHWGYPAKLQRALANDFSQRGMRLEVVNAANVSYTTAESFITFALRCVHYDPDLVIVYHAVNDVVPAFGTSWEPDYSHYRKRLIVNEPFVWDRMPRFLDHFASYVQLRAWVEGRMNVRLWWQCITRYMPDYDRDPYHGTEAFRSNLMNIIAVARSRGTRVLLSTQVCNRETDGGGRPAWPRRVAAMLEMNNVTRSLADEADGVYLVDADRLIPGGPELMRDICHFRPGREGEDLLVQTLADAIRTRLDQWLEARTARLSPRAGPGPD